MSTMRRDYEGPVFGISLTLLCERSGAEVPVILGDILRWLAAHALAQPDVFAEAPKCSATSQLKSSIDSGVPLVELVDGTRPAVVGSLLKRWLEELPDPLLNWDQQVELLSACKDEGCIEARIASLNDAVALVDHIALGTLKPLLLFLQQYCFRQRRFDQQLLQVAVAFAPILFPAALAAGPAELRLAEETVATLVSNALHVFNPTLAANVPVVTPQALCEAAAEIMEIQDLPQQAGETSYECAEAFDGVSGQSPNFNSVAFMQGQQGALREEQPDPNQPAEGPYEPYLQDVPFLSSFYEMVDSCVAAALFDPLEGLPSEHDVAGWGVDDDCGSMTSSCSHTHLSSGGAASSGGASSCSTASVVLASQGDPGCLPNHHHHHHDHHHHHSQGSAKPASYSGCPQIARDVANMDVPYSPRAVLVTPFGVDEEARLRCTKAAGLSCHNGSGPNITGQMLAAEKAVASAHVSAAEFAELAQREVSEGSVFCIISAQPGATPAFLTGTNVSSAAVVGARKPSIGPEASVAVNQFQQRQQPATVGACDVASAQLDLSMNARSATTRRPTEGGAAAGHGQTHMPGQSHEQLGLASRLLALHQAAGSIVQGEPRQRRMAMGGGDNLAAATPQQQQPRLQQHAQQQLVHAQGGGSVGNAVAALYQHLPQLRSRLVSSGSSHGGGAGSSSSSGGSSVGGGSSGGGATSSLPTDRLPPTAGTSSTATAAPTYLADLGVAGHLRVTLTSGLTLAVRELTTPEAMAHRVPIRSMSAAAMQSEKERLKRQLKDLAAAYEAYAGRPLTQALKEPLRPVYVRYHKIKALLSSGRGVQAAAPAGSGVVVSAGHSQQRSNLPASSTRPAVVV